MKEDFMYYSPSQNRFYDPSFLDRYKAGGAWPSDAIEVSRDEWRTYGASSPPPGKQRGATIEGRPTWVEIRPLDYTLNELAVAAKIRINSGYQAEMGQILNDYPQAETLTFDKQEREARQWQADNSVATPYIDAMLFERPLDKAELVGRILAKADAFTMASGMATGKRQRLEDEVKAALEAENRDALEAIDW